MPLGERHADGHLRPPTLVLEVAVVERPGDMRRRCGFGGVGNEGGGVDNAVARVEVVGGGRGKSEGAVVDSGTWLGWELSCAKGGGNVGKAHR